MRFSVSRQIRESIKLHKELFSGLFALFKLIQLNRGIDASVQWVENLIGLSPELIEIVCRENRGIALELVPYLLSTIKSNIWLAQRAALPSVMYDRATVYLSSSVVNCVRLA
jgi:hypothetical protein